MPEAWQLVAACAASLALATWYAWVRMCEAADTWVSAWRYWQSRKAETRAAYDWWRRTVAVLAAATALATVTTAFAYTYRASGATKAAAAAAETRYVGALRPWV